MDEQNQNLNMNANVPPTVPPAVPPAPQKSKFWKFAILFAAILIVAVTGLWALGDYEKSRSVEEFERWAESMRQAFEDFEARKTADTFGGVTPQETLRMYIEAVEEGDYELASKYFVLNKQEQAVSGFTNATRENLFNYLNFLRKGLTSEGSYSSARDSYVVDDPVLIRFELYPSGVWKIVEI